MTTLTKHFFRGLFDFGILTQAGADSLTRMALSGLAGLLAAGFALTRLFVGRYASLGHATSAEPYRRIVLGDDMLIVGLPMLLGALVTLAVSDSLFPNERDFRILGPLPVSRARVFGTKLLALLLFNAAFIGVIHAALAPVMLITSANRWRENAMTARLLAWAIASVGASAFAILTITAIVGVLALALSRSRLVGLTALVKGALLAALIACLPLLPRLAAQGDALASGARWLAFVPPAWFVALERVLVGSADPGFARPAAIARIALPAAAITVAAVYLLLFRHFETVMLRSIAPPARRAPDRQAAPDRGVSPAFRAVFRFTATTLVRSQFHQSVLVGLSGCGVALAIDGARWAPFALMFACALGARASLVLPLEQGANWIFRLTEDPSTRREQLRAVERIVTIWTVGPPVLLATVTIGMPLGIRGAIGAVVVALVGFVTVHAVMFDWRRIPFTSSYLPGKRFVVHTFVLGCVAWAAFTAIGASLVNAAVGGPLQSLAVTGTLAALAYALQRRRIAAWQRTPLMFEDELPDRPLQLELQR